GITDRKFWVCDSFNGIPAPSHDYPFVDILSSLTSFFLVKNPFFIIVPLRNRETFLCPPLSCLRRYSHFFCIF
ncbi:MAG: TylF/MycF family methyltransferase, partial [Parachlamydia sp.]|nr:TylF/MycF family methyltransferase [Parachlamydia sp.]